VLLSGVRADSSKLVAAGYRFQHPDLFAALSDVLRRT